MKKILIILLAVVFVFTLTACGDKKDEAQPATENESTNSSSSSSEDTTPAPAAPTQNMSITIDDRDITVAGWELTEKDGDPALRVYYDITNQSSTVQSPLFDTFLSRDAFQNGEELKSNISDLDDVEEYDNYSRHIYPGVTIRTCENFMLLDTTSDVELSINYRDDELVVNLDLKNPQAPGPAPERVLIPDPEDPETMSNYEGPASSWASDLFEEEIDLKYLGSEIFDEDGQKYIRMNFEMKLLANKDDKETSPFMTTRYYVYQDGIQLGDGNGMNFRMPKIADMGSPTEQMNLGDTHTYGVIIPIISDSPIQVMATAWYLHPEEGDGFVGGLVKVQ